MRSPWPVAVAALVPAGLTLYGVSVPGGYYSTLVAALWVWAIVGAAWLVTGAARLRDSGPAPRWRLWPLVLVPAVFTASCWTASGDLVGTATFAHYRTSLERLADRVPVHTTTDVGPYSFNSVNSVKGCTLYNLRGPGMARASGFAWCPGTTPTAMHWEEGEVFEPLSGDWFAFVVRHGSYENRTTGADPWGLQISELSSTPDV
ncbi:hypothetical protein [Actinoplanes friuliensis]|uniref:Uncharacterized protein n=1 Tax=Actinoplanes friuliensis DSM 7358 TaxID=1246995 RepID=U5VWC6_9ACTN|nr:hypothetical protein [Actinoplanes friuliensis]AGZ41067.1 hypothetical protein AFR_13905 [Actinoplanes friuliensis DSM 7358]